MSDRPTTPAPGPDPGHERELARLLAGYGETWQIERHPDLPVLTATHRSQDGRHIRVLVAYTPAGLRAKLETASVVAYIENGLCPQCGDLTENDQVCTQCGYVSGSKTGDEDDPVTSNGEQP